MDQDRARALLLAERDEVQGLLKGAETAGGTRGPYGRGDWSGAAFLRRLAFLSRGGQSGPAGQEATCTGTSECGLRRWATKRSILVAPGSSTRAETSRACPAASSTQQICWLRT